jgi:hypothetical protein
LIQKKKTSKSRTKSKSHNTNEEESYNEEENRPIINLYEKKVTEEMKESMFEILRKIDVHTLKDIVFMNVLEELHKKFDKKTIDKHYDFLHDLFEENFIPSKYYKKESEVQSKTKTKKIINVTHVPRTQKIIDLPENTKRCPKGYRKHSTKKCFKYVRNDTSSRETKSELHRTKKKVMTLNKTRKKCPKGFRKDKTTGLCQNK